MVKARIEADQRYELTLDYVGTPEPAEAPTTRQRLLHDRLHHHRHRRGVDDAGALRRLHVVPRQRPAVRQGALRRHRPRADAVDRDLQRPPHRADRRRRDHHQLVAAHRARVVLPRHPRHRRLHPQRQHHRGRPARRLLDAARHGHGRRAGADGRRVGGLDRGQARPLPVRLPRPRRHRLAERDGDPDDGHARQQRLRPVAAGDRARARAPVVRRPGVAGRLERRLAQRGHDDADAVAVRGRARHPPAARHDPGRARRPTRAARRLRPARGVRPAAVRQLEHLLHARR